MPRYRMKPGYGKHYYRVNGVLKTVRPGDIIDVPVDSLRNVTDKFEALDPPPPPPQPKMPLYAKHVGGGKWDVMNPATGQPINDQHLTKDEAEALIAKELSGPDGKE